MKIIRKQDNSFSRDLEPLLNRIAFDPEIEDRVAKILAQVRLQGDQALVEFAGDIDHVELSPATFQVSQTEIDTAGEALDGETRQAIHTAWRQVRDFALEHIPSAWSYSPRDGVLTGERFAPLSRVGCYIPGGTAPLVSTVLHTVTLASAAGVAEIVVTTPVGPDGMVNPAVLHAAKMAGATEVYRLGGVYGIGALAFGTESVPRVEKIVGPGNAYVTAAKRQVYGYVALDLVAGPSEIMIIADETAEPRFIAADLLSQAEHGSGQEQAVLVTTHEVLVDQVQKQLLEQSAKLSRQECISEVLENGVFLVLVDNLDEAVELANQYAPEHLEIMTRGARSVANRITAAGAIFLGAWTPEPTGDFVAGPSHVLPTGGAGRYFSGLTVAHFFRRMSVVHYEKDAFMRERLLIEKLATIEGLDAHARSASIRADMSS